MSEFSKPQVGNVVFDMGGVLMVFDGMILARNFTDNEQDAQALNQAFFSNPSWPLLDAGVISEQTMERMAAVRLPERLWPNLHECLLHWHEHKPVIAETNELVRRLHEAGYGCYVLSNAGFRFWREKDYIPCFKYMDGWVVSAFEHIMKPDPRIYQTLCERYALDPATCVFVDDNPDNVRGAEVAGMKGYHFEGAAGLEQHLKGLGLKF